MARNNDANKILKEIKVCCVGSVNAGKTCLQKRFVFNQFDDDEQVTVAASFLSKTLTFEDFIIKFNVWDTCGQERYKSLTPLYYRSADVVIIVYDITSLLHFEEVKIWVSEVKRLAPDNIILAIVGNKADLVDKRVTSFQAGEFYAKSIGAIFVETSALSGHNVNFLYEEIYKKLQNAYVPPTHNQNKLQLLDVESNKKMKCCK